LFRGGRVVGNRFADQLGDRLVHEAEQCFGRRVDRRRIFHGDEIRLFAVVDCAPLAAHGSEKHDLTGRLLSVVEKTRKLRVVARCPCVLKRRVRRAARLLFSPSSTRERISCSRLEALHEQPEPVAIGGAWEVRREQRDFLLNLRITGGAWIPVRADEVIRRRERFLEAN
jgi:hypothetical protein